MIWKRAYELLYIFLLRREQFFADWYTMCHSLFGMRCNSKPLSMICLVLTQASLALISSVLHCAQTLPLAFLCVLNLPASICHQQAHSWLHCIGRVCGQRGGTSIAHKQMIPMPSVLVNVATLRRWNSGCGWTYTFSPFISTSKWADSDFALNDTGNMYSLPSWSIISFNIFIPVDWTSSSSVTEVDATALATMQWWVTFVEKRPHVV